MPIPRHRVDQDLTFVSMNQWFMCKPLPFNPFAPTPEYSALVEKADLLAALVVADLITRFLAQTEASTLERFYASGFLLHDYDLTQGEFAVDEYTDHDDDAELSTDLHLRATVIAFVHHDVIVRLIAQQKARKAARSDALPVAANSVK